LQKRLSFKKRKNKERNRLDLMLRFLLTRMKNQPMPLQIRNKLKKLKKLSNEKRGS
jgi:hypothetical protein